MNDSHATNIGLASMPWPLVATMEQLTTSLTLSNINA